MRDGENTLMKVLRTPVKKPNTLGKVSVDDDRALYIANLLCSDSCTKYNESKQYKRRYVYEEIEMARTKLLLVQQHDII